MALPDRLPEPPDDLEGNSPTGARPDWLVGAEEGAASEQAREGSSSQDVKLSRPAGLEPTSVAPSPPRAAERIGLPLTPPAPARPVAWTGVGNSVPRLTAMPAAGNRPVAEPDPDDDGQAREGLPDGEPSGVIGASEAQQARVAPRPLDEPWWMVVGEQIANDRRVQLGIGGALALVLALAFWPRSGGGVSLHDIERNPERFEGRSVKVAGRVGEVFPLGSGYVFNLHQGRDTIVVFTRTRHPERSDRVQVTGEVSAGYLDGRARLAILESPTRP